MKYKTRLFGPYLPIFALIFLATISMRSIALFTKFNFSSGYYDEKILINISDYLVAAAVIFFLSYIFTARKDINLIPNFTSPSTYIPTGIVSVAIAFLAVELLKTARTMYKMHDKSQRLILIVILMTVVLAVLSTVHFVITSVIESHASQRRAKYGLCTVLFLSMYVIYLYFSSEILFKRPQLTINAPNKIVDQMAYLSAAVFFLYEARLSINREKWRPYIAFGFTSALLTAYSSIPSLIIYFSTGNVISNSIYESALTFALFAFIISRLLLTGFLIDGGESGTVSALITFASAREDQITPKAPEASVTDVVGEPIDTDDNQITIDDLTSDLDSEAVSFETSEENEESGETAAEGNAIEDPFETSLADQTFEEVIEVEPLTLEIPTEPEDANEKDSSN